MTELDLKYPEEARKCLRLNQCYLCKGWQLEKNLSPVEVPDQVGWIEKKACQECLGKVMDRVKSEV